jgi:hypothetical protein
MTTPTLKVEIAFDDDPLTVSPTWTDVTAYVRDNPGVRISRGRPTELDTFTAGQCSFTLDNRDGEFSPLNSGSTYNGKLLPGKQVRVTATYSSTDYRLFRGFCVGWPQRYAQGKKDAIVPIVAYDALSKLNETTLPDRMLDYVLSIATPWRFLRSFDGNAWVDAVGSRPALRRFGSVTTTPTLGAGLESDALVMASGRMAMRPAATAANGSWSFWISTTSAGASSTDWMAILSEFVDVGVAGFCIGIDSAGLVRYTSSDYFTPATARSLSAINDGNPHHVVVTHDSSTAIKIIIDGMDDTNTSTGYVYGAFGAGACEEFIGQSGDNFHDDFTGSLQDVISWSGTIVSEAQALRIYQLGTQTYQQDTDTALGDVLDAADWPAGLRSFATNTYGQAIASWGTGANALSVAQQVATTEQGRFFVSGSGNITLLSRYSHQLDATANTSQHTFSDDGSDSDYMDVGFDYDDTQVRNDITVSSPAGTAQAEDATSITAYGRQSTSVSTFLATELLAQDMADGLVGWRKDPQLRSLPLSSVPQTDPAQWPSILALELGQRVTFEITPPGVGSQVATELILEQMDWDISIALWELTVQASPVPPTAFVLDVSELDSTDVLGF